MNILAFAGFVVLGYVLGSCPWGYWLVRAFRHEDIRRRGSGNIGFSNVLRTYGIWLAIPVVALDGLKAFVPTFLALHYAPTHHIAAIVTGLAAMAGHARPLFLRFAKGGKAIAAGGGAFFALAPLVAATGLAIWIALLVIYGAFSLSSIAVACFVPIGAWLYAYPRAILAFSIAAGALALVLHKDNIVRLLKGTEPQQSFALIPRLRAEHT